jgi:hypothetical protein
MQMLTTASKLDWTGWVRGVVGAAVSGGAASIGSGFAAMKIDPAHDLNIFALMGWTFLFSAIISLAKFLQLTPVPAEVPPPAQP